MRTKSATKTPTDANRTTFTVEPKAQPPTRRVLGRLSAVDRELLGQLLSQPWEYIHHPLFTKANAEKALFGSVAKLDSAAGARFVESSSLRDELDAGDLGAVTLTTEQEQRLFQRFNYARFRVWRILKAHQGRRLRAHSTSLLLAWLHRVLEGRSEIVQINLPLVLAMAKRTRLAGVDFGELISEGNMALLRSVDKFDCGRGFKFSTYACRAILKSFSRVAMRTTRYRGMFPTEFDPALEKSDAAEMRRDDHEQDCVSEVRDILSRNLANLTDIEATVIRERFALDPTPSQEPMAPKTLEQVGELIGVTKERVRQIQNKALQKIRHAMDGGYLAA
jgi:RNA polymerase primary sigma factor